MTRWTEAEAWGCLPAVLGAAWVGARWVIYGLSLPPKVQIVGLESAVQRRLEMEPHKR